MKKIYSMAVAAFICNILNAQLYPKAGFEDLFLTPESYYNGADGDGDFNIGFLKFSNFHDAGSGFWSGFSVSNTTDVTTAGWGNQYSAYSGTGRNSSNYAVFYPSGSISAGVNQNPEELVIDSLWITNTTYAAISMRDGDAYGKQFGSLNDATGNPDGTNGEDFLRVWVIGESYDGMLKDSVEVYLADYRSSNNALDYILDTWLKVDLTGFSFGATRINFRMESSDNSVFSGVSYMNTPSYFAIDDVFYHSTLGISENYMNVSVYPNPFSDQITINGENGSVILSDINGKIIFQIEHSGLTVLNTSNLPAGVYLLEIASKNGRSIQKLIK